MRHDNDKYKRVALHFNILLFECDNILYRILMEKKISRWDLSKIFTNIWPWKSVELSSNDTINIGFGYHSSAILIFSALWIYFSCSRLRCLLFTTCSYSSLLFRFFFDNSNQPNLTNCYRKYGGDGIQKRRCNALKNCINSKHWPKKRKKPNKKEVRKEAYREKMFDGKKLERREIDWQLSVYFCSS